MTSGSDWDGILKANAEQYARVAIANIGREFPYDLRQMMSEPGDFPNRPKDRNPIFYGSLDWHSCVEMHWLLVRLLRSAPDSVPADDVRAALDRQFSADAVAGEIAYVSGPDGPGWYAWGWALTLAEEAAAFDDPDSQRWAGALRPLADAITDRFSRWLPKMTYPIRYGMHSNTAFALSRSLAWSRRLAAEGDPAFAQTITDAASRWYQADAGYPASWEPSGTDFLSPALVEAELMAQLLAPDEFSTWFSAFLPGIENGEPTALFQAAVVTDSSDGQIAHLHGLNASRAWCWRTIAERLPPGDARIGAALAAARAHADAALPHVVGDHYMVEHWLAAYAVLLLT
jgi:hypothetical protein